MESEVNVKLQELIDFGKSLESLSSDKERFTRMVQQVGWSEHIANLNFSVDGYNEDPRELEDIPEVVQWAKTWIKRQPFAPYFLSGNGFVLLQIMVTGSIRIGKKRIPNLESAAAGQFEAYLKTGLEYLNSQYGHLYPVKPFLVGRWTAMELANEKQRLQAKPWWRFW
ncbi:hypothetical protein MUO93_05065 [Candidatus Bathyarchaeota archaeon]|nr:hypothetical protein [Candidatus Bathyarchaeota archaeon]